MNRGATALYRFYGAQDDLLYVGITNGLPNRLQGHDRDKPWWHIVTAVKVEHFPNRADARAAEIAAIHAESPAFNRADRLEGDPPRFAAYGLSETLRPPKSKRRPCYWPSPERAGHAKHLGDSLLDWMDEIEAAGLMP